MTKRLSILCVLIIVQLGLTALVWMPDNSASKAGQPLLALTPSKVQTIKLVHRKEGKATKTENSLKLAKVDGKWQLGTKAKPPTNSNRVAQLLDKLDGLTTSMPVAVTEGAQKRFKVAQDDFAYRIDLTGADGKLQLYVGSAAGAGEAYVRKAGENAIYAVALPFRLLSTHTKYWKKPPVKATKSAKKGADKTAKTASGKDTNTATKPAEKVDNNTQKTKATP